jgi:DNA-directed RNA polymerase specialized sigma54-like protein
LEQHTEEDSGVALDVMCHTLESLGYRVVSKVKAFGLFAEGEAKNDKKALNQAYNAGEKLFKAINLRNKIMQQVGEGLFKK